MSKVRVIEGAELIADANAEIGEGPVWDARTGKLWWVDILGRRILATDPATGETESFATPSEPGSMAPRRDGGWIVALSDGFWTFDPPEGWRHVAPVDNDRPDLRFNDGKADQDGRFWAGTMAFVGRQSPGAGALYRLDPDYVFEQVLTDVTISNGMVFLRDPETTRVSACYYIDTPNGAVESFAIDPAGRLSDRRMVIQVPSEHGDPDGMTIDDEGGLWVALWNGSRVQRYVHGTLEAVIPLPVSHVTSVTFGGPELDELYITSAWSELTDDELAAQPTAGGLFRVRPGVRGMPVDEFAG